MSVKKQTSIKHESKVHRQRHSHPARTEQDTGAEEATTLRAELATLQASLASESKTGWGTRCKELAARIDAGKARLDALTATTTEAREVESHASPLLVLCARFNLPEAVTLNIAAGVMLLALNAAGFMLLYLSAGESKVAAPVAAEPITAPAPAPVVTRVSVPAVLPSSPIPAAWKPAAAPAAPWLEQSRKNIQATCGTSRKR